MPIDTKVRIYLEYHSVCPLVRTGIPHPLFPQRVCPPWNQGGKHSPAGEGVGEVPIRTTGEKAWHSVYSVPIVKKVEMGGGVTHPPSSHHPIFHLICVHMFLDVEVYTVLLHHGCNISCRDKKWDKYLGRDLAFNSGIKINSWARICRPFKESKNRFPVWRASTTTLFVVPARQAT